MKSRYLAVAVGLVLSALPAQAQTGAVYSLNVVGFQKVVAISNGMSLVSTPFDKSPNTLDDVIGNQLTGGKSSGSSDLVVLWDSATQRYLTYWLKSSDQKWYDASAQPATNTSITPLDGLWIQNRRASNETVVVVGDVPADLVVTNVLVPGMNLVSYPFSAEVDINKAALTNGTAGKSSGSADLIVVWDKPQQRYLTYWLKSADRQWYDVNGQKASNVFVGAGVGFWYQNRSTQAFHWVEARPYTL